MRAAVGERLRAALLFGSVARGEWIEGVSDVNVLVLLDQLGMGRAIIYHDCPATREVIGDAGLPFGPGDPVGSLAEALARATRHPEECAAAGERARRRAELFRWENVVHRYEEIFNRILSPPPGVK
jgi:glycosyltransferase involved in cell wall biosynthesis